MKLRLAATLFWLMALVGLVLVGCEPGVPTPPTSSVPATTAPATTAPPVSGDASDALMAALAAGDVVVDRPLVVNKIVKVTASNRILTFTGAGKLIRTTVLNPTGDNVTFPVLEFTGSSNIRIVNPQIEGPGGVCNVPRPGGGVFRAYYTSLYEEQAGIALNGVTGVTVEGGSVTGVRGDGVKIFYDHRVSPGRPSRDVVILGLRTRCVGRAAVANISSDGVSVIGGDFRESGLWTFNVEPFNTLSVLNYRVTDPVVGYSSSSWLFVGGPYFGCVATGSVVRPVFVENVMGESIASCVRSTFTVTR